MIESEDGPRPDPSVMRSLHAVDPDVYPVWRNYWMDATTGRRIYRRDNGEPIFAPQWWIMKRCRDGRDRLLFRTPYFDNRVWRRIQSDAVRHLSEKEIDEIVSEEEKRKEIEAVKKVEQDRADFRKANPRIKELFDGDGWKITDDRGMYRDQKISSYAGQHSRTSGRESVMMSDKEAGWEIPGGKEA